MSDTNSNPEALWDSARTASFLGLGHQRTLNAWRLKRTGPPYIKVGRLCRYDPQAVRAWLAARTVAAPVGGAA